MPEDGNAPAVADRGAEDEQTTAGIVAQAPAPEHDLVAEADHLDAVALRILTRALAIATVEGPRGRVRVDLLRTRARRLHERAAQIRADLAAIEAAVHQLEVLR